MKRSSHNRERGFYVNVDRMCVFKLKTRNGRRTSRMVRIVEGGEREILVCKKRKKLKKGRQNKKYICI